MRIIELAKKWYKSIISGYDEPLLASKRHKPKPVDYVSPLENKFNCRPKNWKRPAPPPAPPNPPAPTPTQINVQHTYHIKG